MQLFKDGSNWVSVNIWSAKENRNLLPWKEKPASEVSDKVIYEKCSKFKHISQNEVILV